MNRYSRKLLWIALLLCFIAADGARGQWRIVAPNLIPITSASGAICFHDGIVWIAASSLFMSSDSGITWSSKRLPLTSYGSLDIEFQSATEGVLSDGDATWTTGDAGASWQQLTQDGSSSACFLNNVNDIVIADMSGSLGVTMDGGNTWSSMPSQQIPFCVRYKSGTVYLFGGIGPEGFIYTSGDFGLTWKQGTTGIDWDSYSFAIDSCDQNRIYLSHDDAVAFTDRFSKIFLTTDRGDTWRTMISNPEPFFSGSVAEGNSAIYCQSIAQGVFRSTDRGMAWGSIGGPSVGFDTRLIAALSDNILLGVDRDGNVWRTDNSGGDSVLATSTSLALNLNSSTIITHPGDTLEIPIYLSGTASLGATTLTLPFGIDTNVLRPIEFQPAISGITVGSITYSAGTGASSAILTVPLQSAGLTLNGEMLIGYLRCVVYLADTLATSITLQNASLNSATAPCTALSLTTDSVNILINSCGDSTLLQFMKTGAMPLAIQSITPNPASNQINIRFRDLDQPVAYELIDALGTTRLHGMAEDRTLALDVTSLPPGVYFFRACAEGGDAVTQKVVVER